jgi:hypothetical protein
MLEPIQDNDNYKPHATNYSNYTCLLKLSRKQESVTVGQTARRQDGRTDGRYYYIPSPLSQDDNKAQVILLVVLISFRYRHLERN